MNDNVFAIFKRENIEEVKTESVIKEPKVNVFGIVNEIFKLINTRDENHKVKLNELLDTLTSSDISFIKYILNHDLAFNDFTRKYLDIFTKTSYGLEGSGYIYWFVNFMIFNKIKFPMFMVFYKFGINNNNKKYKEYILTNYDLDEDELNDIENVFKINDKDIYYAMQ